MKNPIGRIKRFFGVRVTPKTPLAREHRKDFARCAKECERLTGLKLLWPVPVSLFPADDYRWSKALQQQVGVNERGNVCEVLPNDDKLRCWLGARWPIGADNFIVHDFGHSLEAQHQLQCPKPPKHHPRWSNILPFWYDQESTPL